jgi:hypothetical protein
MQTLVNQVVAEAKLAAQKATEDFLAKHGDRDCCGFAWVTVYEKGSTKLGKALTKAGFSKAYGGGLEMWNPSGSRTQCITAKEVGAQAAAKIVSEKLGVTCYAGSRLD